MFLDSLCLFHISVYYVYVTIFQRDVLSPLLLVIVIGPLNHILRKWTGGYNLNKSQEKINHLMYIDDIKLFAKNKKELGNPYTNQSTQKKKKSRQRNKHLGCLPRKILRTILQVDEGRTSTNRTENKKTYDDFQDPTSQRWYRQLIRVKKIRRKRTRVYSSIRRLQDYIKKSK